MTVAELEKLLAEISEGPWTEGEPDYFGDYTISGAGGPLAIAAVTNGEMRRMGGRLAEHEANARAIAMVPTLLRKAIAGEKLAEAVQASDAHWWAPEIEASLTAWEAAK